MMGRSDIRKGMAVHSRDGAKVGRVLSVSDDGFVVEKGIVRVRDYLVRFAEVAEVRGEDVRLSRTRDELEHFNREGAVAAAMDSVDRLSAGTTDLSKARMDSARLQEHERYVTAPTGEGPHGEVEGPRRRASGPGWDALGEDEDAKTRS